jgi:hypothetical protein
MHLPYLDDGDGLEGVYALAYRITDVSEDPWTHRLNRFKGHDKAAWAGSAFIFRVAFPKLFNSLKLEADETAIISALSSGATKADPKHFVSRLANFCAKWTGARAELSAVTKQAHPPIHGAGSAAARDAILDTAKYAVADVGARTIIVMDDFITRGGTMSRIAKAAVETNPDATVYGVALGKTERRGWWAGVSNDHVPKEWEQLWEAGEQAYRERK